MPKFGTLATALLILAGSAFADPFSGRYELVAAPDFNVPAARLVGVIEVTNAPMGTTSFSLHDAFVSDFEFKLDGYPLNSQFIYDTGSDFVWDFSMQFGSALGTAELHASATGGRWVASDPAELAKPGLRHYLPIQLTPGHWRFFDSVDDATTSGNVLSFGSAGLIGQAWHLELASTPAPAPDPVPEPGTLVLSGLAVAGALVWRRRKRAA